MGKRIDAATRAKIVEMYLSNENATYAEIGKHFGINQNTISKIIKRELQAGKGIVPDRRKKGSCDGLTDAELKRKHDEVISKMDEHPRTTGWMQYITPLHKHKIELEQQIEHKQAALEKAKQEYRDFLATLQQLREVRM